MDLINCGAKAEHAYNENLHTKGTKVEGKQDVWAVPIKDEVNIWEAYATALNNCIDTFITQYDRAVGLE